MKFNPRYIYMPTHPEMFPREYLGFVDPDDWYAYDGVLQSDGSKRYYSSFEELYFHIVEHRKAEHLSKLEYLPEMVGQYLYEMEDIDSSLFTRFPVPAHYPRTFFRDLKAGVGIAISLSKAAVVGSAVTGSWGWVDKKTANTRALSCYNCPFNTIVKKNLRARAADALANLFTTNRRTDYDKDLDNCGVCGCPNRVKVHFSEEVLVANHPEDISSEDFPDRFIGINDGLPGGCWLKSILKKHNK